MEVISYHFIMKTFSPQQSLSLYVIHMSLFDIFVICFEHFYSKLTGFFEMILKISENIDLELERFCFLVT